MKNQPYDVFNGLVNGILGVDEDSYKEYVDKWLNSIEDMFYYLNKLSERGVTIIDNKVWQKFVDGVHYDGDDEKLKRLSAGIADLIEACKHQTREQLTEKKEDDELTVAKRVFAREHIEVARLSDAQQTRRRYFSSARKVVARAPREQQEHFLVALLADRPELAIDEDFMFEWDRVLSVLGNG